MDKGHSLITDKDLAPFHRGIDEFCAAHLPTSVPSMDDTAYKIFADPIEGYVHPSAWQVAIVDTPLFQRLRGIRQLGLTYLVYPTLGYCRFQHTLGVLARLKQVLNQLQENHFLRAGTKGPQEIITSRQRTAIELAALCHDIGHCVFSHVSETVTEKLPGNDNYPAASRVLEVYRAYAGRESIALAEVLAAAIVTSYPFIKFLLALGVPGTSRMDHASALATDAARLIFGLPLKGDPGSLFLGQLMSSGLDVDKLDYMLRESHMSGISLGISLEWLLKKLFVCELSSEELSEDLKARVKDLDANARFRVLSVEKGGQFAFEEFSVARLTLHEKIYLHQKIRAAEVFVKNRLLRLSATAPAYNECHRWLYLRESQFEYPKLELPALPQADLFSQGSRRDLRDLELEKIASRNLLYRAFAFGWFNAIAEPLSDDFRSPGKGTDRLAQHLGGNQEEFIAEVKKTLEEMRPILGEDCPLGTPEILVDLPRLTTLQQGHETLHIEHPSRLSLHWTMPIDQIVEYYHKHRALAYVFTQRAFCPYVLLAVEKVAWDKFGALYVQEAAINGHVVTAAKNLKSRLHEAGFYSHARPLQPISEYLGKVYPQTLVARISKKLAHYESRTKQWVSPASVATFLSQFPVDLQEAALEWLQHLDWIDPSPGIRRALNSVFGDQRFAEARRVALCPLGATSDSANRIAYDLRDVGAAHPGRFISLLPLTEALARRLDAYIFYDDNTNTGYQALNIMASWLDRRLPSEYALKEEHVQPLDGGMRAELLSKPVAFIFSVGTENSRENVTKLLVEHAGLMPGPLACFVDKVLYDATRIFSGAESPFQHRDKLRLREFLRDVAVQIFVAEGQPSERAARRSLGDGQAEAMVVFPYNCPTMTVPALWLRGRRGEDEWLPLVERARRRHPETGEPIGEDA
jgi:hypothetical protein